jgi:hypothetical protein
MMKFKWVKRVQFIYDDEKVYKIDYSNKDVIVIYAKVNKKFVMKYFMAENYIKEINPYDQKYETTITNYILVGANKISN